MATLTPSFRDQSRRIHAEHAGLLEQLDALERELDRVVPGPDGFDALRLSAVQPLVESLLDELPGHCEREERHLLGPVAEVSPELAEFSRAMKREHDAMLADLRALQGALAGLSSTTDSTALGRLREEGIRIAGELRRHVRAEERELSGFL